MLHSHVRSTVMFAFLMGFASIRAEEIPDGIMPKRQVAGTGVSSAPPSTTVAPDSSTPISSDTPIASSTQAPDTTTDNGNNNSNNGGESTSAGGGGGAATTSRDNTVSVTRTNSDGSQETTHISTDGVVQTKSGEKNSVVRVGSTTVNPSTLSHKTTVKQPLVTKHTIHTLETSIWTGKNGVVHTSTYSTDIVNAKTTGFATATVAPSLANSGGDGDNLSSHAKKIIGGVVGGIGGAILIGGLAFVAWRLWGKKKQANTDNNDYYHSPHDSISGQKRNSTMTYNTESQYTNPNGAVNTASNF